MARAAGDIGLGLSAGRRASLALTSIIGALLTVVLHPVIGLPIAGSALALLALDRRPLLVVASVALGAALATLLAHATVYVLFVPLIGVPVTARAPFVYAATLAFSLVAAGPGVVWALRRYSALATLASLTVALAVADVAALAALAAGAGRSLQAFIAAALAEMVVLAGSLEGMTEAMVGSWPSLLVVLSGFAATLTVVWISGMAARRGIVLKRFPPLQVLDLDVRVAILPILAVAFLAIGRFVGESAPVVESVGMNLLVVARWVFFLQGIAVFAGLYHRAKFPRPVRSLGFVVLGVTEMLVPAVSLTGLADVWLNLRRLPREAAESKAPGGPTETP